MAKFYFSGPETGTVTHTILTLKLTLPIAV